MNLALIALATAASPPARTIWTNEEQVDFAREAGTAVPAWTGFMVDPGGRPVAIDRFARPDGSALPPSLHRQGDGWSAPGIELRRARNFRCWIAVPRQVAGKEEWLFARDLKVHDGGGRVTVGGGTSGYRSVTIRLRNVIWPAPSRNKPSLVLYVFDQPLDEHAVSYGWADPDARLIGVNLRFMQASCSPEETEK